jgi:hypothetical protein
MDVPNVPGDSAFVFDPSFRHQQESGCARLKSRARQPLTPMQRLCPSRARSTKVGGRHEGFLSLAPDLALTAVRLHFRAQRVPPQFPPLAPFAPQKTMSTPAGGITV